MYTLQILHASDLEGGVDAISSAPNFAAITDALETEADVAGYASVLLSAGDNYIPGPFFNAGGDFSLDLLYEGFYNALFGLIDTMALAAVSADTNGDGFFDNGEIETAILAGDITFDAAYTTDINGDGAKDYFEEIDTLEGRIDIAIMNRLEFDASAVGNHEFDAGTDAFENAINYDSEEGNSLSSSRYASNGVAPGHVNFLQEVDTPGVQFPYLSANLDFSGDFDVGPLFQDNILVNTDFLSDLLSARDPQVGDEGAFPAVFDTAGTADSNDQKIAPATIIQEGGEQIGVIGATTQLIGSISSTGAIDDISSPGVNDMAALAAVLQPVVDEMTTMGVNKIILVSHLQQFALEQELAGLLSGVDVIIAGGSDTLLADETDVLRPGDSAALDYPFETTGADGNPVLVVSTDGEYSYVGRLVVDFDDNGVLIERGAGELVDAAESGAYATDEAGVLAVTGAATLEDALAASDKASDVANLANAVTQIVTDLDGDVAGKADVFLNGLREAVRTEETNLGNLTADANLAAVNDAGYNAVISIKNGGGVRAPIGEIDPETGELLPTAANPVSGKDAGEISELDIDNVLRFDNGLVVVELSPADLKIVLEHAVAGTAPGATPGQFPQIGGFHFSFDPNGTAQVLDGSSVPTVEGTRVQNVALIGENGLPTQHIIVDGEVAADAPATLRVVTLDFLASGGDGYPFDLLGPVEVTGIGEQKALSDFLTAKHPEDGGTPYSDDDQPVGADTRIQNLGERSDTVDAPIATQALRFEIVATFDSGDGEGGAEVVAEEANVLYVTNGEADALDVFDIATKAKVGTIDLTAIEGYDGVQSVAVKNGLIAVAIAREEVETTVGEETFDVSQRGFVAFFDAATLDLVQTVDVGHLPDQLVFNDDGSKLYVANEGEFNDESDYDDDPLGTVAIVDIHAAIAMDDPVGATTLLDLTQFTGAIEDALIADGVRVLPGNSLAEDAEPEYITLSPDGRTAVVSLQENNAVALIDLRTETVTDVLSLGVIDRSVVPFDPNNDGVIDISQFEGVVSLRQADAIKAFEVDGKTYVATANEGDNRGDFDTGDVEDLTLDPALEARLGAEGLAALDSIEVSLVDGDTDGDGDIDVIHTFGGRSFSIFDADGELVFDSGADFEKIIAEIAGERFNDDDGDTDADEDRSDDAGPEPEAIEIGVIDGATYAFIGLERDSGIMIYDVSDPANSQFVNYIPPVFVDYAGTDTARHGPEVVSFISADASTTGNAQIAVAYEISGTTVVYDLTPQYVAINELRIDQSGDDDNEYFELFGSAGASLDGYSYVAIGDDGSSDTAGSVEAVIDLSGHRLGSDGLFLVAEGEGAFPSTVDADLVADLNFENGDNVTHMLVKDFAGAVGDDLDADDDGTLDTMVDTVDSVALVASTTSGNTTYSDTVVGPDGSFLPAHVFRETDGKGDFAIGAFTLFGDDTPGFSNEAALPLQTLSIPEIQGAGHVSAHAGELVETGGIVTAVDSNGYYLQDAVGDGDVATSDGIFVFTSGTPSVSVGDEVALRAFVSEYIPGGASSGNLSVTQLSPLATEILSSGNPLPLAQVIGAAGRTPPTETVISDSETPVNLQNEPGTFNPDVDGIDFYESIEGMLVTIDDPVAIAPTNRFGEIWAVADNGAGVTGGSPGGGLNGRGGLNINANADGYGDLNPERIQIQIDSTLTPASDAVTVGDDLADVTGVVSYEFGNYQVVATEEVVIETPSTNAAEVTDLVGDTNNLKVATYNVLNVTSNEADGDADQIARIARQIVDNLGTPDIVALQEIQDNSGETDDGTLDADETLAALVDAIVDAGGPRYAFHSAEVDVDGETGGVPGGNIRNAFLYNPSRVEAVDFVTLESAELAALGATDPEAFNAFDARDPLLGVFTFNGETVTLINNHFESRSGSTPIFGGPQPFEQNGEDAREAQAKALNEVVDSLLAADPDARVMVLGDLNTFEFTDEIAEDLSGTGAETVLTNLIDRLGEDEAYTYIFDGNSQVLDHILVTDALLGGAAVDVAHVNTDFPAYASDHDPVVASFTIDRPDGITEIGTRARDVIVGGAGDDELTGRRRGDEIDGQGGDDDIRGGNGADVMRGGLGNDEIFGALGKDSLFGEEGDDALFGNKGSDFLNGGAGEDFLRGGRGVDRYMFDGFFGNDTVQDDSYRLIVAAEEDDASFAVDGDDVVMTVSGDGVEGTVRLLNQSSFDMDSVVFTG